MDGFKRLDSRCFMPLRTDRVDLSGFALPPLLSSRSCAWMESTWGQSKMRSLGIAALCAVLGGCGAINVRETTLSTNQKVAIVSSPGDGVSPPSSTVLLAGRNGQFVPVSSGYAQAPVTAALSGAVGGMAIGAGNYAAARVLRPTQVNQVQTGGNVTGATASSQGASSNAFGGSASGGTGIGGTGFGGSSSASGGSTSSFSAGSSSTSFGGSGGTAFGGSGGTAFGGSGGSSSSTSFGGSGGTAFGGSSNASGGSSTATGGSNTAFGGSGGSGGTSVSSSSANNF